MLVTLFQLLLRVRRDSIQRGGLCPRFQATLINKHSISRSGDGKKRSCLFNECVMIVNISAGLQKKGDVMEGEKRIDEMEYSLL